MADTVDLLILHLSDIHFRTRDDLSRVSAEAVAAAVSSVAVCPADVLICVSGDIGFSGRPDEYEIALEFFSELESQLKSIPNVRSTAFSAVPGNHDCDFARASQTRQILVDSFATKPLLVDESVIATCTGVQDAAFNFTSALTNSPAPTGVARLSETRNFDLQSGKISIVHINTAWMSSITESQGGLFFPSDYVAPIRADVDLAIAMFHHPYNWMEASSARAFRERVEAAADVVLTGHEHVSGAFERSAIPLDPSIYLEGAVLADHGQGSESGFHVIRYDLQRRLSQIYVFTRSGGAYRAEMTEAWRPMALRNAARARLLTILPEFEDEFLQDPGAPYTHRYKSKMRLGDLYVFPDFDDISFGRQGDRPSRLRSSEALTVFLEEPKLLLIGSDDAGKTSVLKNVFSEFAARGMLPVYLRGEEIRSHDPASLRRVISRALDRQYGEGRAEEYWQQDVSRRAACIDDFDTAKLNKRGQNSVLGTLEGLFGHVVVTADDLFQIERVAESEDDRKPLLTYRILRIRELGFTLRGKLIERWIVLGREHSLGDEERAHEVTKTENLVNTLLGKNLFPSYPFFVLTVLQTLEAATNLNTASVGTYGYVYEALIAGKLAAKTDQVTLDTKFTFLGGIAHDLFSRRRSAISQEELRRANDVYFERYRIRIPIAKLLRELTESSILAHSGEEYWFKYKYVLYYFVAKHLALNLLDPAQEPALRAQIAKMAGELYHEDSANVLLFLVYLTRDPKVLQVMLEAARSAYSGQPAATMVDDLAFINSIAPEGPDLALTDGDAERHRQEKREELDRLEEDAPPTEEASDEILRLNFAMKAIQILGQVLRNFPGSLPASAKVDLASEVYDVSLRTLHAIYVLIRDAFPELKKQIALFLSDKRNVPVEKLAEKTDRFLFLLMVVFTQGIFKRVSSAVGSDFLSETYKEVVELKNSLPVTLIDLTIKLDHFKEVSLEDLLAIAPKLRSNPVAFALARRLVRDRLDFFPTKYPARQALCEKFDIEMTPKHLGQDQKKRLKS